jgi:hypothetical protein
MTVFSNLLNSQFDAGQGRFRVAQRFNIVPKPGISRPTIWQDMTAEPNPNGDYAVFEFTGALLRAKLYSNWQVVTNDQKTLEQLASPTFDPAQTVLVADPLQTAPATATNQPAGTVDFVSYTSKKIALKTKADTATVMLLNDKYDPDWKALVDGKPATLLRCNFIVQGVQLAAGQHTVELRFEPQIGLLWVSLGTIVLGLALLGIVIQASRVPGREGPPVGREARHSNAAQPERVRV